MISKCWYHSIVSKSVLPTFDDIFCMQTPEDANFFLLLLRKFKNSISTKDLTSCIHRANRFCQILISDVSSNSDYKQCSSRNQCKNFHKKAIWQVLTFKIFLPFSSPRTFGFMTDSQIGMYLTFILQLGTSPFVRFYHWQRKWNRFLHCAEVDGNKHIALNVDRIK